MSWLPRRGRDVPADDFDVDTIDEIEPPEPPATAPPVDLLACEMCAHRSSDLAGALAHAWGHARSWRNEAQLVESQRRGMTARALAAEEQLRRDRLRVAADVRALLTRLLTRIDEGAAS